MKIVPPIVLLLTVISSDRTVNGAVLFGNSPMPGATIMLVDTKQSVISNQDGEYHLQVPDSLTSMTIEISSPGLATTRIENIEIAFNEIQLPAIHLFPPKVIGSEVFNLLTDDEKTDFEAMYHWNQLIGFASKTRVDNDEIFILCNGKIVTPPYEHVSVGNKIVFDFKDIPECR
jgi:hypothetical protein